MYWLSGPYWYFHEPVQRLLNVHTRFLCELTCKRLGIACLLQPVSFQSFGLQWNLLTGEQIFHKL